MHSHLPTVVAARARQEFPDIELDDLVAYVEEIIRNIDNPHRVFDPAASLRKTYLLISYYPIGLKKIKEVKMALSTFMLGTISAGDWTLDDVNFEGLAYWMAVRFNYKKDRDLLYYYPTVDWRQNHEDDLQHPRTGVAMPVLLRDARDIRQVLQRMTTQEGGCENIIHLQVLSFSRPPYAAPFIKFLRSWGLVPGVALAHIDMERHRSTF